MSKKSNPGKSAGHWDPLDDKAGDSTLLYATVQALETQALAPSESSASSGSSSSSGSNPENQASQSTLQTAPNDAIGTSAIQSAATLYPSTSISKVYQHWADGDAARNTSSEWNNNILSDGKSDYFEGEVVPHVYFYKASNNTPLVNGNTYTFNVTYNHYQSNTNAGGFVYMTSPFLDRTPTSFAGGEPESDGTFSNGGGMQGEFLTVNADITEVSAVNYSGNASIDGTVSITFVYTGPTTTSGGAEIQYGLRIAAPGDVADQGHGITDGASSWTGGSLQTTVDIDGSGATSIQLAPSAIIRGEISGTKFHDINGDGQRDAFGADDLEGTEDDEVGLANWKIYIDLNGDGAWNTGEVYALTDADGKYVLSVTPDSDRSDPDNDPYIVREEQQTGWMQTTANPEPITISSTSPTQVNVDFGNMLLKPSLQIMKEATVGDGSADFAGEVITYTIYVNNTGNQTLTGVEVTDPFVSNLKLVVDGASEDGKLDVGETWTYTGSHTVTQAEIDAGKNILNIATADSDQTDSESDDASVPVEQKPELAIVKQASIDGGTADSAGEVINYTVTVQNLGNQTLTGVDVTDPFVNNFQLVVDGASGDGKLDVGETWTYTGSHTVTQAEIDAGLNILNIATADSDQTEPESDNASVPVEQRPELAIVKQASIDGGTADSAGEVINYTVTVQNLGNQTLTGVEVSDPFVNNFQLVVDGASGDKRLDVGETWTYTGSHTVTQAEIDDGQNILNIATADSEQTDPESDDASVPVEQRPELAIDKAVISITGGNGNGSLDALNEVVNYAVTVTNTGNQTLDQITVNDPLTGLSIEGLILAPGASETFQTSYTLTQVDLDTNGGGDGHIENTATADSRQTDAVSDTEEVQLNVRAALSIDKKLVSITQGNGNSLADAAGDQLNYTVTVSNLGVQTLTNVSVVDLNSGLNISGVTLTPGEIRVFETSYVLTQDDLDDNGGGDGYIDNTATADSDQTLPLSDTETTALLRNVGLGLEKTVTRIEGGNSNLFADSAGEVIHYAIQVYNAGTVTLTGVTVTDVLTGMEETIPSLAPGESTSYNTSYTVKQADLDNNGGGNGYLENTSVADSDQTTPVSDTETVQLLVTPILFVNKSFVNVTGGNGNGLVDAVGDELNYQILLANPGNVTLTDVSLIESLTGLSYTGMTLDPGAVKVYNMTYKLTQADLDNNGGGDGYVDNSVTADSAQTNASSDTESVPLLRNLGIAFDSDFTGVTGGNDNTLADAAGDVLNYSYTITNLGNVTLTNLNVVDDLTNLNGVLTALAPGATQTYTASYTLQQSDLDSDGGGNRQVENDATVETDQTGTLSDSEGVTVIYDAQIDLTKYVSVDDGVSWLDANGPTGPELSDGSGINPQFKYTALNNGTITLTDVTLSDEAFDLNGAEDGSDWLLGDLAPGELAEYIFEAPFALGQNSGDAMVTANTIYTPVVDIDNAYYLGV